MHDRPEPNLPTTSVWTALVPVLATIWLLGAGVLVYLLRAFGVEEHWHAVTALALLLLMVGATFAVAVVGCYRHRRGEWSRLAFSSQSERLLKMSSRMAHLGGWSLDLASGHIKLSDEACRILDIPLGQPVSLEEVLSLYLNPSRTQVERAIEACVATGERQDFEAQVVSARGRELWVRLVGEPLRSPEGQIVKLEGVIQDVTDVRRTFTLLARESSRFHEFADAMPALVWSTDAPGRLNYVNRGLADYLGDGGPDEPLSHRWLNAIHPEDKPAYVLAWERGRECGELFHLEFRLRRRDGPYFWHFAQVAPVRGEQGEVVQWHGCALDIDRRRSSEERARQLADQLAATLESISDAFYALDGDWCFSYVNGEAERILQHPRGQLLGRNLWDCFPGVVGTEIERQYRYALAEGSPVFFEHYYEPLRFWASISVYPSGEGLSVYFRDVTEQHSSHLLFERITQITTDTIWDWNMLTDALWWNEGIETNFAYRREDVPECIEFWKDSIHPDDRERVLDSVEGVLASGEENWQEEYRFCNGDGHYVPVLDRGFVIRDGEGRALRMVGGMTDLTEHKAREQEARRVQQLENEHYLATRANETKSQFLASMSHEIRTPINGIVGMVEVLRETPLGSEQCEMVDTIHDSAHSLLGIVDDVLDFSKIEAGKLTIETAPFSIYKAVSGACTLLDRMAINLGVELTYYTAPELPAQVLGDKLRLRQILLNLLNNAVKFSSASGRAGQVYLRVVERERTDDTLWLEFRVRDNGIGMDSDTLGRLFSPFVQADVSTTRHYGGTGLGLSITRNLVSLMGGDIKVASAVDEGTEFRVSLPFAIAADHAGEPCPADLAGLTCLVWQCRQWRDWADYLSAAGARVTLREPAADLTEMTELAPDDPAPALSVLDLGDESPPPALLEARPPASAWLLISRGKRRRVRNLGQGVFSLDADNLSMRYFVESAAVAAGRLSVEALEPVDVRASGPVSSRHRRLIEPDRGLVLVAEDNDNNRKVIARQLELLGYRADMAADGAQALEKWRVRPAQYALVLTDLHMPEMDGYGLAGAIRQEEAESQGAPVPIIALTANATRGEDERCRAAGMDEYLLKPVPMERFGRVLRHWVESGARAAPAALESGGEGQAPVLDLNVLRELIGGDAALVDEFVQSFRDSSAPLAAEISALAQEQRWEAVADRAHSLKSSARTVGAQRLAQACAALEAHRQAPSQGATMDTLLEEFQRAWAELQAALDEHMED